MEYTINIKGRLMDLSTPQVMGILNVTPDSFYSGSRKQTEMEIAQRANQIIEEGGSIIDVGAFSTRPGADEVSEEEEGRRLKFALDIVRREQPDAAVSVDTYRPTLARKCIEEWGADIINDVSEGGITGIANVPLEQRHEEYPEMFRLVGELKVPYILMSVQPTLAGMMKAFSKEVQQLRDLGAKDIILDPGFGFGKNLIQNYQIYNEMEKLNVLELPVLVGISRKSMIYKLLGGDGRGGPRGRRCRRHGVRRGLCGHAGPDDAGNAAGLVSVGSIPGGTGRCTDGLSAVGFSTGKAAPRPVRLLVCSGSHWLHSAVHWLRRAEHPAGTALLGGGRHGAAAGPVLPLEGQAAVCGGTAAPLAGKARHECSECFLQPVRTERVRAGAGRASGTLGLSA